MLILWGMKDFVFDHHFLDEWVRRFPGAEVHRFPQAGHYLFEDEADAINGLVHCVSRGPARHRGARRLSQNLPPSRAIEYRHPPEPDGACASRTRWPSSSRTGETAAGRVRYTHLTYRQLDQDSDRDRARPQGAWESPAARGPW